MSIIQGTAKGGSTGFYDYPIGDSLRFDGSSYLSRTPTTAGNRKTWTWSGWVKLGVISSSMGWLFGADGQTAIYISDGSNSNLRVNGAGSGDTATASRLRDPSAWYSIVVSVDTTNATAADRLKIYINGVRVTDFDYNTNPTLDADTIVNSTNGHSMGYRYWVPDQAFNGYLAEVNFIDGQALDASYFGETKGDIWIPKTFDGTSSTGGSTVSTDYGTNGFLLDFSSISGTTINDTAPIDTNHSSANNWTATGF